MGEPATGLLVVDAQQGLLQGEKAIPQADLVIDRLAFLLAGARSAGAVVIHLQNDGAPGSPDEPETPGWLIHRKLTPEPGEVLLRKKQDDGFENTELQRILECAGVKCIAVGGVLSEMCVSATVRGGLARGFEVILVHDAHATYNLDDIPAAMVSRVAEHALGSQVEIADSVAVAFERPNTSRPGQPHP